MQPGAGLENFLLASADRHLSKFDFTPPSWLKIAPKDRERWVWVDGVESVVVQSGRRTQQSSWCRRQINSGPEAEVDLLRADPHWGQCFGRARLVTRVRPEHQREMMALLSSSQVRASLPEYKWGLDVLGILSAKERLLLDVCVGGCRCCEFSSLPEVTTCLVG